MIKGNNTSGIAVALAWPSTYCKQPGAWYDIITNMLGFSPHHFYQVGHAALILINKKTRNCHYYDFGRYHAPFQHGRVRSEKTDPGLKIHTQAQLDQTGKTVINLDEILTELQHNEECHGDGALHASYCPVNFEKAIQKATILQDKSPIPYGPFQYGGSNCSRFVNDTIAAGSPPWIHWFKLRFLVWFTPTPMNNIQALQNRSIIPYLLHKKIFVPQAITDKAFLKTTLRCPDKPEKIPHTAQWLSGEGCGSWFAIQAHDITGHYEITRYNPEGKIECKGLFKEKNEQTFDIQDPYQVIHLSHYQQVRITQKDNILIFVRRE